MCPTQITWFLVECVFMALSWSEEFNPELIVQAPNRLIEVE
jgi:hypothetical protein